MSKEELLKSMAEILELDEVNENLELDDDIWNSLSIVSTIALIDENFNITISGDLLNNCKTIGDLWKLIEEKINH